MDFKTWSCCCPQNIDDSFYAFELFTELGSNGYDMHAWGLDEKLWIDKRIRRKLGVAAIIPHPVLELDYITAPSGVDKLGDYSERDDKLFTTRTTTEPAKTVDHLANSINMTTNLFEACTDQSWFYDTQKKIFNRQLNRLNARLAQAHLESIERTPILN